MNGYDRIRELAQFSIGRACLFGLLAIFTFMIGLVHWPSLAMRSGAILFLMTTAILMLKAVQAPTRNYRRTEVWILLGKRHDLPESHAQAIFGEVLRSTYVRFARISLAASVALWAIDVALRLTGIAPR
jgi:hypothetical protein